MRSSVVVNTNKNVSQQNVDRLVSAVIAKTASIASYDEKLHGKRREILEKIADGKFSFLANCFPSGIVISILFRRQSITSIRSEEFCTTATFTVKNYRCAGSLNFFRHDRRQRRRTSLYCWLNPREPARLRHLNHWSAHRTRPRSSTPAE